MKLTKIFILIAITGLFLSSCGGGGDDDISKFADMQCEMYKLKNEMKDADDAKKEDLTKKVDKLRDDMKTLGNKIEDSFKDDKKADYNARIKMSKTLLNCPNIDEKGKERLKKHIERSKKKLEELDK